MIQKPEPGTYIIAVSGGVDSVVLLDMLARQAESGVHFIVAHIDHGIRDDSAADARFVAALAEKYRLPFELCALRLGKRVNEEVGRRARYAFLHDMAKKYEADAIITAHHADDVVETIVLNVLRGTGWRGVSSLRSREGMLRPLLEVSKQDILNYALSHRLEWCEDETNYGNDYLRNRIRHWHVPRLSQHNAIVKKELMQLWRAQCELHLSIDAETAELTEKLAPNAQLAKTLFLQLDGISAFEVLRLFLLRHNLRQTSPQLLRALAFVRRAGNTKRFSLDAAHFLEVKRSVLVVVTTKN